MSSSHSFPDDIETLEVLQYPGPLGLMTVDKLTFTRVEANPGPDYPDIPKPDMPAPGNRVMSITMGKQIGQTATHAVLHSDNDLPRLVIKRSYRESRVSINREKRFYDILLHLQGTVIPRCYGLFNSNHEYLRETVLLLEEVGARPRLRTVLAARDDFLEKFLDLFRAVGTFRLGYRWEEVSSKNLLASKDPNDVHPYRLVGLNDLEWGPVSMGKHEEACRRKLLKMYKRMEEREVQRAIHEAEDRADREAELAKAKSQQ